MAVLQREDDDMMAMLFMDIDLIVGEGDEKPKKASRSNAKEMKMKKMSTRLARDVRGEEKKGRGKTSSRSRRAQARQKLMALSKLWILIRRIYMGIVQRYLNWIFSNRSFFIKTFKRLVSFYLALWACLKFQKLSTELTSAFPWKLYSISEL